MQVLVTGGTGVLGRRAIPLLVKAGYEVRAVSRRPESDDHLRLHGAEPVRLDLLDPQACRRAARGHEAIVDLATAIPASPLPPSRWRANDRLRRDAAGILARTAIDIDARYIRESFAPTYADGGDRWITEEHPLDPVDQTRTVVDAEAAAASVTAAGGTGVVLRFGLFLDATSGMTRQLVDLAHRGLFGVPGRADAHVPLVTVDDAASAVVSALEIPAGTYNVVTAQPITRAAHAAILGDLLGRRVRTLPRAVGRIPYLRVLGRSQRLDTGALREAGWRSASDDLREVWARVIGELE